MILYLDDVLINSTPYDQDFYDCIHNVLLAYKEGKHVVVISPVNAMKLLSDNGIDTTTRMYLQHYLAHNKAALSFLSYFKLIVSIVPKFETECSYTIINTQTEIRAMHVTKFTDSINIQQVLVLGENGNDAELYKVFCEYYKHHHKLSFFEIKYKRQSGGGDTIAAEYKAIFDQEAEFCLCILDSDKKSPNNSYGQTARKVKKYHDECAIKNGKCCYIILDALEIENLLPLKFFEKVYDAPDYDETHGRLRVIEDLNQIALSYFDFKEGLKALYSYNDQMICDFWYPLTSEYQFKLFESKGNFFYLRGFGPNILENALKYDRQKLFSHVDQSPGTKSKWLELGKTISSFIFGTQRNRAI